MSAEPSRPKSLSSRLAVLLFSDIVGSTDIKSRLGTPAYSALLKRHNRIFEESIARFAGAQVLKHTGDGYVVSLATASDAVRFALLVQAMLRREEWDDGHALTCRMGVHVGEVAVMTMAGRADVVGLAADTAGRVMSLAGGGQILLTRFAFDEARQFVTRHPKFDAGDDVPRTLKWIAHGAYACKGLSQPIEVFEVGVDGISPLSSPDDSEKAKRVGKTGAESLLGWRPAAGQSVPGREGWTLQKKLGDSEFGEVWQATSEDQPRPRAFQFCFDPQRAGSFKQAVTMMSGDDFQTRRDASNPLYLESELSLPEDHDGPPVFGGDVARPSASKADLDHAPKQIGPYRILELIAEGAMGAIYKAEQRRPVKRLVAVKVIKLGLDTKEVIARFDVERQALAMMDHPNIAKVFDAGATETGRPYFVMEYVPGEPITQHADRHNLPIRQRLELFCRVCEAVQHAHMKGIIHRDLKPSNILASTHEDQDVLKVIDFGIAKATGGKLTDKTLFTEHRRLIGTPEYMSPEQAEGSLDIDTRTDVYALGVLLYQLLTGSLPFSSGELRTAAHGEIQRIIREVDPPKPSTRLSQSAAATITAFAAHCTTEPRRLEIIVRGELDWIVMKALDKDRARRYETANGLAMDIRRYLAGDAVLAAPPGVTYRMRKFVRRNRVVVSAAGAVAAALTIGLIAFAWQAKAARDQRDRAVAAELQSKQRADELKVVADFQASMLAQIDATKAGQELTRDVIGKFTATLPTGGDHAAELESFKGQWGRVNATDAARDLIDRTIFKPAIAMIDAQFKDQPIVDAQLRQTLATRYYRLGLYDAALALQTRALATRRRVLGDDHPDTIQSIGETGSLLWTWGKLNDAEPYVREAVDRNRRVHGESHPETLTSLNNLGTLLQNQQKFGEAEPACRAALDGRRRVLGDDHPDTLGSLNNLGYLLWQQGKLADAEPYYREALERSRRTLGVDHQTTVALTMNTGALLYAQGKLSEAEPRLREAMAHRRRTLGEEHPETLVSIINVAAVLRAQSKFADAEPLCREVVEKSRRVLGADDPNTLKRISYLGSLLVAQRRFSEAEPLLRDALSAQQRALGADQPRTLESLYSLADLLVQSARYAEASPLVESCIKGSTSTFGAKHQQTRNALSLAVRLHQSWEAAEPGNGHQAVAVEWQKQLDAAGTSATAPIAPAAPTAPTAVSAAPATQSSAP